MSSTTWMPCAERSDLQPLALTAHRAVESQSESATRKLVDSHSEHELLEAMLEASKPAVPQAARGLNYLLSTPFRYPPLRYGSRFGRRHEQGIWYGSLAVSTVLAEIAYYRLVFLSDSEAFDDSARVITRLTAFRVDVSTEHGVDLTGGRYRDGQASLRSKDTYTATQALGTQLRELGASAFQYASARAPDAGMNVGVFEPSAFASAPHPDTTDYECFATHARVEFHDKRLVSRLGRRPLLFRREQFEVNGRLPHPPS